MQLMNPTLHFLAGNVANLPFDVRLFDDVRDRLEAIAAEAVYIARNDWNSLETSWAFAGNPLVSTGEPTCESSYEAWAATCQARHRRLKE